MATEDSCLTRTVASALGWGPPKVILKGRISAQVVYLEAIPRGTGSGWVSETGEGRRPTVRTDQQITTDCKWGSVSIGTSRRW